MTTEPRPPPSLRAAAATDAESLASLHAAAFDEPWDAAAFLGFLDRPGCLAFVATDELSRAAVGFIIGHVAADEAEILSVAVDPAVRRAGIGQLLLRALLEAARDRYVAKVHLEVADVNTAALALYQAEGFIVTGRRKGYYARATGRVDAVVMSRSLG